MNAYHNAVYGGCGRPYLEVIRWILSQPGSSYETMRLRTYGGSVWTCGGKCEKAMSGICLSGHVMRLASQVLGAAYVDHLVWAQMVEAHAKCAGIAGGCSSVRTRQLERAPMDGKFVDQVLGDLHLLCSEKAVDPGQVGDFLGLILDTVLGKLALTQAKFLRLLFNLHGVLTWDDASPRDAAQVRGKRINYAQCIQRIRPFAVPFTAFIGNPAEQGWDARRASVQDMKEAAKLLIENLPRLAPLGAALWRLETCCVCANSGSLASMRDSRCGLLLQMRQYTVCLCASQMPCSHSAHRVARQLADLYPT